MSSEDQQALRLRLVYFMRRLFFSSIFLILLTGCQSKKDICADVVVGNITCKQGMKKLGIKYKGEKSCGMVGRYCEFYKN